MTKATAQKRPRLFPMPTGHSGRGWHEIEPFTRCPKEYQLGNVRGIRPHQPFLPEPLGIGLMIHAARAQWLYDGRDKKSPWRDAMRVYAKSIETEEEQKLSPGVIKASEGHFAGYVDYWSHRPVTKILAIEHQLELRGFAADSPAWVHRTARLDSIEKHMGKTWIGEAKSTSDSVSRLKETYMLHGQILLQVALWGEEETEKFGPLAGVLIDPIVKGRGNKPSSGAPRIEIPIHTMGHALFWFKRDFKMWVMQASMIDKNSWVERRPVCMRQYGPCQFRDLCLGGHRAALRYVFRDGTSLSQWKSNDDQRVEPWE
jgi:hypothetical protein